MAHHAVIQALDEAVEELSASLSILSPQIILSGGTLSIAHDDISIFICAPNSFKAYMPKKYRGFTVCFLDADRQNRLTLDTPIITKEKHGIYVS